MYENPKKKFLAARSTEKRNQYVVEDVFDELLESRHAGLISGGETGDSAMLANESPVYVLPVQPPAQAIRRAIQELESGSMDELIISKLIALDRDSAEFRSEYVRLRALSYMRPRPSSSSLDESYLPIYAPEGQMTQEEIYYTNPWVVNTLWDLWTFFAPGLTITITLQIFFSYKLSQLLRKLEIPTGNLPYNMTALLILLISLFTTFLVLRRYKGQDYNNFSPPLIRMGIVSGALVIISFVFVTYL